MLRPSSLSSARYCTCDHQRWPGDSPGLGLVQVEKLLEHADVGLFEVVGAVLDLGVAVYAVEPSGDMRMLVEQIAQALVDAPDQVQVTAVDEDQATVLELRVAATDLGKVIGKQGRTAKSIRTILGAASMKLKQRYTLEIIE